MKAMIVFEVDDLDDVVVYANVYKREQGWKRQIGRLECVKPVPIPQKKADENGNISEQKEWIENEWDFISGWNACIDEILGEKK